jgi:hypothetical protein
MRFLIICGVSTFVMSCGWNKAGISNLKLVKALPVEYRTAIEPSGLTSFEGEFYTVSDDHDHTIFKLEILEDRVLLRPHIQFTAPKLPKLMRLDLEGITCDNEGNFYLCSEGADQILFVSRDGSEVHWVFESLKPYGQEKGFFQIRNAGLEGIALIDPDQFVLCIERQPRGVVRLNLTGNPTRVEIFDLDETKWKLPEERFPDFTGLYSEGDDVYVLTRGASVISKLVFKNNHVELSPRWSYSQIENSDEWRYANTLFTSGEGLCMDEDLIYVILDNNGEYRYSNPKDKRPLLFIMQKP